jgi:hypothetical protein
MCHHCFVMYKNRTYTIVFHQRYQSILYLCNRIYMSNCCCYCLFVYYTVPTTTNKNIYYRYPFLPLERDEDNYRRNYWVTSKRIEAEYRTSRLYTSYFKGIDQRETRRVGKVANGMYLFLKYSTHEPFSKEHLLTFLHFWRAGLAEKIALCPHKTRLPKK